MSAKALRHHWQIDADQYARHEKRRGHRHAYEALDPGRTALIVVDMIPFFVNENPYCRGIVPTIAELAGQLRASGGVVAWVVPGAQKPTQPQVEFYGQEVAARYGESGGSGPLTERIWHEFSIDAGDAVLEKFAPSAFFPGRCDLDARLQERDIDTVLICGTVANVCCESSIRDAQTLGYRVVAVADAMAAARDEELNATLHTVYRSFGDVRPASELRALIAGVED